MSDKNQARRAKVKIYFGGADITKSVEPYFMSLTYIDNEEDECDDIQIKLQDRDGKWVEKWLKKALNAAAKTSAEGTLYKVTSKTGVAVRKGQGTKYKKLCSLPYGKVVKVHKISGQWAEITVNIDGKDDKGYVSLKGMQPK